VISDRYVDSSLAYQGAGRTLPVQEISWLSSWATGGLKPDLVVLLDVDPDVGLNRVESRGAGADRLESESRAFHERVRYAFLDLAAADPKRYLVLDASRPADEIASAVRQRLEALLAAVDAAHPERAPAGTTAAGRPAEDGVGPERAPAGAAGDRGAAADRGADRGAAADRGATGDRGATANRGPTADLGPTGPSPSAADLGAAGSRRAPDPVGDLDADRAAETPLEEMAEVLGIDDGRGAPPDRRRGR
jgi:dTMP kinase